MTSTSSTSHQKPPFSMSLLLLIGLILFFLWAGFFKIDQTVRAQGQIVPSAHTQIIQAADGGVLAKILVQEGQEVTAGEVIAVLESERSSATFDEVRSKVAALSAALARAKAEVAGRAPNFASVNDFPQFVTEQKAFYEQRRYSMKQEMDILQNSLELANEELLMNQNLIATGDTSRLEVMRSKRQVEELQGKINAVKNKYLQDASVESVRLQEELSAARFKLEAQQDILKHSELKAPVNGIVKYLKINTIGGVLRPGDELMQISPTEGGMIIEIKVNPMDIGQIKMGMPASIKLDAYDYSIYGTIKGEVSYIGSDTLTEQTSDAVTTYYRVRIVLLEEKLKENPKLSNVLLKPGMTTSVDILTNTRSVLQYLLKPIYKGFSGALNER